MCEQLHTSSALSSAMGLDGLLVPPVTLVAFPELSSSCKNFIKAVSCVGLDCSIVCLRYLQEFERDVRHARDHSWACVEVRGDARVQSLFSLLQKLRIKSKTKEMSS